MVADGVHACSCQDFAQDRCVAELRVTASVDASRCTFLRNNAVMYEGWHLLLSKLPLWA